MDDNNTNGRRDDISKKNHKSHNSKYIERQKLEKIIISDSWVTC